MKIFWKNCGAVSFGLLLLGALEFSLKIGGYGRHLDLVLSKDLPGRGKTHSLNVQYVAFHYFSHLPVDVGGLLKKAPWFSDTEFPAEKSPETFRIFVVGESTARGFPYDRAVSFPRILQEIVKSVIPSRRIEVINAAFDALSSYGVLDVVKEVLGYQPDLVIVQVGHNEFIGHYGVNSQVYAGTNRRVVKTYMKIQKLRVFLLMKRIFLSVRARILGLPSRGMFSMMRAMVRKIETRLDDPDHRIAEANFRANIEEIIGTARHRGVKVVFMTLASNLKDLPPIRSVFSPHLTGGEKQQWVSHFMRGRRLQDDLLFSQAVEEYQKAARIDAQYAELHYRLGQSYEALGEYEKAREGYIAAREYDTVHLRACNIFNAIIREVCGQNDVPVVDTEKVFEGASENRLVGSTFFLEHLHPNFRGHFLIAREIARLLFETGLIAPQEEWDWSRERGEEEYRRMVGFTREIERRGQYTVGRLLIDFPFYQCEKGVAILQGVNKAQEEQDQIRACMREKEQREKEWERL